MITIGPAVPDLARCQTSHSATAATGGRGVGLRSLEGCAPRASQPEAAHREACGDQRMSLGSQQKWYPSSRADMASISPGSRSGRAPAARLARARAGSEVRGRTEMPCCMAQRRSTCAGVASRRAAARSTASFPSKRSDPCPRDAYACTWTPAPAQASRRGPCAHSGWSSTWSTKGASVTPGAAARPARWLALKLLTPMASTTPAA
mmetsp:Transcript_25240/g.84591  ORF Transcript_25240/g.84591 Transcript_25240/m.84591 type:complete len:206 (+) Transcript_25240:246-863(+)